MNQNGIWIYITDFAIIATRAGCALGLGRQLAGDWVATRVGIVTLFDRPAIAFLAVFHDAVAARAEVLQLMNKIIFNFNGK